MYLQMKIVNFDLKKPLPPDIARQVDNFLSKHVKEGSVELNHTAYFNASFWSLVFNNQDLVGFSAQKIFFLKNEILIQVMATFIKTGFKQKKLSSLLLQGFVFYKAFIKCPLKPIYWCSRTRVPGAYIAAEKYSDLYPRLTAIGQNKKYFTKFCNYARLIYGEHVVLHPETYVMKHSYGNLCSFLKIDLSNKKSKYSLYFNQYINYENDETIFMAAKIRKAGIAAYLFGRILYNFKHIRKGLSYAFG